MLYSEDLQVFSGIGKALWMDQGRCERSLVETLSAISLLNLTPERGIEKACRALLARARKEASGSGNLSGRSQGHGQADFLMRPFFRSSLEQKFVLVALHLGRWSYLRLARILEKEPPQVEEFAWSARIQLGSSLSPPAIYPAGPTRSSGCPHYHFKSPWTQRFLDGEFRSKKEKVDLGQHLLHCETCHEALTRCREFYFRIDQNIRQEIGLLEKRKDLAKMMEQVLRMSPAHVSPSERTVYESLRIFVRRWEIRTLTGAIIVWALLSVLLR